MNKPTPPQLYLYLCEQLRQRIEFAEIVISYKAPRWQVLETVCLQGRKSIETVAHMALVSIDQSLGSDLIPRDIKTHWSAKHIFESLKKKNMQCLPSPSRMEKSTDPRFKAVFCGIPDARLSYDDLIEMSRSFDENLHAMNPYRKIESNDYFDSRIPGLANAIDRLRKFVWIHYIGIQGTGFMVDLKNEFGKTVVRPVSKMK